MNTERLQFVEDTALLFEEIGLTRMAGRIYSWLMVADETEVSFDGLTEALQASKGSISTNIKMLENLGLVESVSLPGDRKTYYRLKQLSISKMLDERIEKARVFNQQLDQAQKLRKKEDHTMNRIREFNQHYSWLIAEFERIKEKAKEMETQSAM